MSLLLYIMYRQQLCNERTIFSHNVEMNNKGILHFYIREETGAQRTLTERLMRSRLQLAGHVERMADDRLPKRAAELREQGRRRRWRPRLRWEDCVKRDVKRTGEEGDWKKKTGDRGGWKRLSDEAVKKLLAAPHPPDKGEEEEREREIYLERSVPVEELEDCHEFLELQHCVALVRLKHETERTDARTRVV